MSSLWSVEQQRVQLLTLLDAELRQAPYCSLTLAKETRRTKPIKKGGQHPEWDEEVRFSLLEDTEDILRRTAAGDGDDPPPVPSKKAGKAQYIGKSLRLACYADDAREPEFIGEVKVDLTEALTKGEVDGMSFVTACSLKRSPISRI